MAKFIFKADVKIEADNLDQAFLLLARHFLCRAIADDEHGLEDFGTGEMSINPEGS